METGCPQRFRVFAVCDVTLSWSKADRLCRALIANLLMLDGPRSILCILRYTAFSFWVCSWEMRLCLGVTLSEYKSLFYPVSFWFLHVS
jgi:hypothetical protein